MYFIFFKEKADWDGVLPLYSEAGGLKVASPGVLFISPYFDHIQNSQFSQFAGALGT